LRITGTNISFRYKREFIFQNLNFNLDQGDSLAILGSNGSGKSTLLQVVSTFLPPTSGELKFMDQSARVTLSQDEVRFGISMCSPALELEQMLTLDECFNYHFKFINIKTGVSKSDFFDICFLTDSRTKRVAELSSGMRQRLKLALCFLSESNLILLDEPCSNLDEVGVSFYQDLISKYANNTTQMVASNKVLVEYNHCTNKIHLGSYNE